MASELVASLGPGDLQRETDLGNDTGLSLVLSPGEGAVGQSPSVQGDIRAMSLPKYVRGNLVAYGYTAMFRIPLNLTLATGLTFKSYITDDGQNAADLGTAVVLGITLKRMAANATVTLESGAATEVTGTLTLSSTSGGVLIGSIAIANAALPASTAAGDLLLMRVRRLGSNASDTCQNRVLLYRVEVNNT